MTGYGENATIANGFLDPGTEMIPQAFWEQGAGYPHPPLQDHVTPLRGSFDKVRIEHKA